MEPENPMISAVCLTSLFCLGVLVAPVEADDELPEEEDIAEPTPPRPRSKS